MLTRAEASKAANPSLARASEPSRSVTPAEAFAISIRAATVSCECIKRQRGKKRKKIDERAGRRQICPQKFQQPLRN